MEVDKTPPGDYLKYGELAKAEKADIMQKGTPLEKNQFVWDSYLQKQAKAKAPIDDNAEPVKKVMAELGKSNTADALFQLGQIQEVAGNLDEAQKTYQKGADQFKDDKRFKAALTRVEVMRPEPAAAPPPKDKPEPEKQSRRAWSPPRGPCGPCSWSACKPRINPRTRTNPRISPRTRSRRRRVSISGKPPSSPGSRNSPRPSRSSTRLASSTNSAALSACASRKTPSAIPTRTSSSAAAMS